MNQLYPLQFKTIFKDKIWGGDKIKTILNKDFSPLPNCGETWEISGVEGNESVVKNGPLSGITLPEVIDQFREKLVGDRIYQEFRDEFPLLIKFIDAADDLSIQVHPDDTVAMQRHGSRGKTEMWYIIQSDDHSRLISGFAQECNKETYLKHLETGDLDKILNYEPVYEDDAFFIPAGRVHSIGKGILLTEIQETSDVTYRIYDFNRKDEQGNTRELHTDEALDVIDFNRQEHYKTLYIDKWNEPVNVATCEFFTVNKLLLNKTITREYNIDSFKILICLDGQVTMNNVSLNKGSVILLPALTEQITLKSPVKSKLLEVYM